MGMYCHVSIASREDVGRSSAEGDALRSSLGGGTTTARSVSIEKAWHGLHYLLTGEVWQGHGPLAFLMAGGEQLGENEESPLRWFAPNETVQIHEALSNVSDERLWS